MDSTSLASILAGIVGIIGAIVGAAKWAVTRVVKSMDASTDALIKNTESHALHRESNGRLIESNQLLMGKLDKVLDRINRVGDFVDEVTGQHEVPDFDSPTAPIKKRARTAPHGIGGYRVTPRKDDD